MKKQPCGNRAGVHKAIKYRLQKAANRTNYKGHVPPRHRFAAGRVSESCYLNNRKCPDRKNMFGHFSYLR